MPAAFLHHPRDADAELVSQLACQRVGLRIHVGLENNLGDSPAIAQVDENTTAMIAARGHPAEQHHRLAGVGRAQRAAVVRSFQFREEGGLRRRHAADVNTNRFGVARRRAARQVGSGLWVAGRASARAPPKFHAIGLAHGRACL